MSDMGVRLMTKVSIFQAWEESFSLTNQSHGSVRDVELLRVGNELRVQFKSARDIAE